MRDLEMSGYLRFRQYMLMRTDEEMAKEYNISVDQWLLAREGYAFTLGNDIKKKLALNAKTAPFDDVLMRLQQALQDMKEKTPYVLNHKLHKWGKIKNATAFPEQELYETIKKLCLPIDLQYIFTGHPPPFGYFPSLMVESTGLFISDIIQHLRGDHFMKKGVKHG